MTLDTAGLRALIAAATPGPWVIDDAHSIVNAEGTRVVASVGAQSLWPSPEDAAFIIAAREVLPALLAERAALRRRLKAIVGLNAHYRIGSTPSEKLLAELDASRDALAAFDSAEGADRG